MSRACYPWVLIISGSEAPCAVADGRRSGRSRCRHACQRGIGSGVDRKVQPGPLLFQQRIELKASHPSLHCGIHVRHADSQHFVHSPYIDRDATGNRDDSPLDGRTCPERDDRHAMLRADANAIGGFFHVLRECHGVRRLWLMVCRVFRMFGENVFRKRQSIADSVAQSLDALGSSWRFGFIF